MTDAMELGESARAETPAEGSWARFLRRRVLSQLRGLRHGAVRVEDVDGAEVFGRGEPEATVKVTDARFYRELALGGSLGAAEAYIRGYWSADDLTTLLRIFARDIQAADAMERGIAKAARQAARLVHRLRANTRRGSERNVHAHYDLGNDFFALFLDDTLTYSCGVFERPDSSLQEASVAKLDRICRKLALRPEDRVLEIGAGWGSFALHAASNYGCHVTTTTISRKQHQLASERVKAAGLDERIRVLLADYRQLGGRFDKLVSIEMIEAVGHDFLDIYFRKCSDLLADDGMMALQAIVIHDQRYDQYRRSVDFIRRYVFPGGHLPSLGAISGSIGRATDLRIVHVEDLTPHYAKTLRIWREHFLKNADAVLRLGYSAEFVRLWEYYLCYCEAGFRERYIGNLQILFAKAGFRGEATPLAPLPPAGELAS